MSKSLEPLEQTRIELCFEPGRSLEDARRELRSLGFELLNVAGDWVLRSRLGRTARIDISIDRNGNVEGASVRLDLEVPSTPVSRSGSQKRSAAKPKTEPAYAPPRPRDPDDESPSWTRVWTSEWREAPVIWQQPCEGITCIGWSPCGRRGVTTSTREVVLWNLEDGSRRVLLGGRASYAWFDPSGARIAVVRQHRAFDASSTDVLLLDASGSRLGSLSVDDKLWAVFSEDGATLHVRRDLSSSIGEPNAWELKDPRDVPRSKGPRLPCRPLPCDGAGPPFVAWLPGDHPRYWVVEARSMSVRGL